MVPRISWVSESFSPISESWHNVNSTEFWRLIFFLFGSEITWVSDLDFQTRLPRTLDQQTANERAKASQIPHFKASTTGKMGCGWWLQGGPFVPRGALIVPSYRWTFRAPGPFGLVHLGLGPFWAGSKRQGSPSGPLHRFWYLLGVEKSLNHAFFSTS